MSNNAVATMSGRSIIWNRVRGNGTEPKNLGWGVGTNPNSAAITITGAQTWDVNLFYPQTDGTTRAVGTSTLTTTTNLGDTYKITGTITCLVAAKTITEAALFDAVTMSPTTTLAASITSSTTTISLGVASGITSNYYRQIANEVVLVTAGANTTLEGITRAQLGSVAAVAPVGTPTTVGGDGGAGTGGATSGQTATIGLAQGGNVFAHADFAGIALNVNDSILFSWTDQLT